LNYIIHEHLNRGDEMKEYQVKVYDNRTEWYFNGKLHREDGPAVERSDGYKYWYLNGKRHREDGPAVEWPDGSKSWWINGKNLTEQEFLNRTTNNVIDIDGIKVSKDGIEEIL
jgi:hypothetical protein